MALQDELALIKNSVDNINKSNLSHEQKNKVFSNLSAALRDLAQVYSFRKTKEEYNESKLSDLESTAMNLLTTG